MKSYFSIVSVLIVLSVIIVPLKVMATDFMSSQLEGSDNKSKAKKYYISPSKENAEEETQDDTDKEEFYSEEPQAKVATEPPPPVQEHYEVEEPVDQEKRLQQISTAAKLHAKSIASTCIGKWENQKCLHASSDVFLTLSALYAEDLQNNGHKPELENIKEHCAASTAATRLDDVPAYAMRSAYVECVNEIFDITERTSMKPDIELYQLMVMSVLCMDKDPRCGIMEMGLKASAAKL